MIDYTQLGFQSPVSVSDPIPSVADYLNDYTARNRAWYQSFAYPQGGGFGARPESFEVRGAYMAPPATEAVTPPPILRQAGGDLTQEDTRTRPEDMPIGQMVRDPADMTNAELWNYHFNKMIPSDVATTAAKGTGFGLLGTLAGLAGQGVLDYDQRVLNEIGRRMGEAYARQPSVAPPLADPTLIQSGGGISSVAVPGAGGTRSFIGGDVLPVSYTEVSDRSDADRGYSSADRSGRSETQSQRGGLGGV